jgi:hypothetical protein
MKPMDDATKLAALKRLLEPETTIVTRHEIYHDDAVLEFPQSQERYEGRANFLAWRKIYPAEVEFKIRSIRGGGDVWVVELTARYDGGPLQFGCSIHEFKDLKIIRETIYIMESWEAPEWRAKWRARWKDESLS